MDGMDVATTTVGVRELKNNLSSHLAAVREGTEIIVTDHGHPIARLTAVGGQSGAERLAELIAGGEAEAPRRRTRTAPKPERLPAGATVSDLVSRQRR
jgi:prevent-host-death family protein